MSEFHRYNEALLASVKRIEESCELSKRDKQLILGFKEDCVIRGLGKPRIIKYLSVLPSFASRLGKELDQVTLPDIQRLVSYIQQQNYSVWTKHGYKVMLKRFYKWLYPSEDGSYPKLVSWIKNNIMRSQLPLPAEGDLFTEEDIKKLIETAEHPRDKALVAVLWESGCRVGEIGTLKLKNVAMDKYGMILHVFGKTGSRSIRIIFATPYLSTWLNNHPLKNDRENSLWVNIGNVNHHQPVQYANIRKVLQDLFRKAGISKKANPHMFRHSRATFLANYLTEFQMNQYFGWVQGSEMPATYVHMSGKAIDSALLTLYGLKPQEKNQKILEPRQCPRCETLNNHDSKYCNKCSGILDLKLAMEMEQETKEYEEKRVNKDQLMDILLKDPQVQELLIRKMKILANS